MGKIKIETSRLNNSGDMQRLKWVMHRPENKLEHFVDDKLEWEKEGNDAIETYYKILE